MDRVKIDMKSNRKTGLIIKILMIGGLLAVFAYLLHPGIGNFSVIVNGEPIAEPMARFAAVPTFLLLLLFTFILMVLAFLGMGFFIFLVVLLFGVAGFVLVAPYFWPVMAIVLLTIILTSFGSTSRN